MTSQVIRQSLVPMLAGYLILMAALATGLRLNSRNNDRQPGRPQADRTRARGFTWTALIRRYLATAIGGYLLLVLVDGVYYYAVARVGGNFIDSGISGTALLLGLTAPVFALLSWITEARAARRGRSGSPPR